MFYFVILYKYYMRSMHIPFIHPNIPFKAQFFFNHLHHTQYWLLLRLGVGDLDLRELLNPVVMAA